MVNLRLQSILASMDPCFYGQVLLDTSLFILASIAVEA